MNLANARTLLQNFDFTRLFVEEHRVLAFVISLW